jgi:hypothetical protein
MKKWLIISTIFIFIFLTLGCIGNDDTMPADASIIDEPSRNPVDHAPDPIMLVEEHESKEQVVEQYPTLTDDEFEEFEYLLDAMNWDNVLLDQDMEALNSAITESKSQDILTTIELTQYDIECSKITVSRLRTFLETHGEILERNGQDVNAILASIDKTDEKIKNVEHEIGK